MRGSIHADLHVHTTNSDGDLVLDEIPAAATEAGIAAVAVTDHDRIHPGLDAPLVRIDGIDVIHGLELRVEVESLFERIDLLGYGVTESPALCAELDRLQANRKTRSARIIELVERELGITLDMEVHDGIGRPHIARAIDATPRHSIEKPRTRLASDSRILASVACTNTSMSRVRVSVMRVFIRRMPVSSRSDARPRAAEVSTWTSYRQLGLKSET